MFNITTADQLIAAGLQPSSGFPPFPSPPPLLPSPPSDGGEAGCDLRAWQWQQQTFSVVVVDSSGWVSAQNLPSSTSSSHRAVQSGVFWVLRQTSYSYSHWVAGNINLAPVLLLVRPPGTESELLQEWINDGVTGLTGPGDSWWLTPVLWSSKYQRLTNNISWLTFDNTWS